MKQPVLHKTLRRWCTQSYTSPEGQSYTWEERLLVIRSDTQAKRESTLLDKQLKEATDELLALTPPKGRGRRQIRSENHLVKRAEAILQRFSVQEYLRYR